MNKNYLTVSQVNQYINDKFRQDTFLQVIFVEGEISNCKYHSSGHIYFTLKDKSSQLACVMFSSNARTLDFHMKDGQNVVVGGSLQVYEQGGKYQLYARKVMKAGAGVLYEKYEQLKKKLEEMGLFDTEHKKAIPRMAKRIGIVTAVSGAAIQDIIQIAKRRNPYVQLVLYPAQVQGEGAEESIIQGIQRLDREQMDVIIVGRGGGSIEDLWAFNSEEVAMAIFKCETPIVSAVGHESDITIADFVADFRAPTPSAAAEITVMDYQAFEYTLWERKKKLYSIFKQKLDYTKMTLVQKQQKLLYLSPEQKLNDKQQFIADSFDTLNRWMSQKLSDSKIRLQLFASKLNILSPLSRLNNGYAYVETQSGDVLTSINQVQPGEGMNIYMQDGMIKTTIDHISEKGTDEYGRESR